MASMPQFSHGVAPVAGVHLQQLHAQQQQQQQQQVHLQASMQGVQGVQGVQGMQLQPGQQQMVLMQQPGGGEQLVHLVPQPMPTVLQTPEGQQQLMGQQVMGAALPMQSLHNSAIQGSTIQGSTLQGSTLGSLQGSLGLGHSSGTSASSSGLQGSNVQVLLVSSNSGQVGSTVSTIPHVAAPQIPATLALPGLGPQGLQGQLPTGPVKLITDPVTGAPTIVPNPQAGHATGGGAGGAGLHVPAPRQLIVNYIPDCVTEEELSGIFGQFGEVEFARIVTNRRTGVSKGYGFVHLSDAQAAFKAMRTLSGMPLYGKRIKVSYASMQVDPNDVDNMPPDAAVSLSSGSGLPSGAVNLQVGQPPQALGQPPQALGQGAPQPAQAQPAPLPAPQPMVSLVDTTPGMAGMSHGSLTDMPSN